MRPPAQGSRAIAAAREEARQERDLPGAHARGPRSASSLTTGGARAHRARGDRKQRSSGSSRAGARARAGARLGVEEVEHRQRPPRRKAVTLADASSPARTHGEACALELRQQVRARARLYGWSAAARRVRPEALAAGSGRRVKSSLRTAVVAAGLVADVAKAMSRRSARARAMATRVESRGGAPGPSEERRRSGRHRSGGLRPRARRPEERWSRRNRATAAQRVVRRRRASGAARVAPRRGARRRRGNERQRRQGSTR